MCPGGAPVPWGLNPEIDALVLRLRETVDRLASLTAADTVLDREGRTLLLPLGQERWRHEEAARQSAILDALPANIALLDAESRIVSVNAAWRKFARSNAFVGAGCGVGADYLAICLKVRGDQAADAIRVAAGIRAVLSGETRSFSIDYPCHSPTQHRWFQLLVTPLDEGRGHGAVVMHLDVTERREAASQRQASEQRFLQMADNIRDMFFLQEIDSGRMLYVSPAYAEIWGRSCESLYAKPDSWEDAIDPADRGAIRLQLRKGMPAVRLDLDFRVIRPDGSVRWVSARIFPVKDESGRLVRTAGIVTDVTERKRAEERIRRLNRVLAVLSGINGVIVRVRDRDELFREACRIAVEAGAFKLAWIGAIDPKTLEGSIAAWQGVEADYIDKIRLSARDDAVEKDRPASRAAREGRPVICNDLLTDPAVAQFRHELLAQGYRSLGCFPLAPQGNPEAVLVLLSADPEAFDEDEVKLLTELASDISFALDHIEKARALDYLAFYDVLTGLANRTLLLDRMTSIIRGAAAGEGRLAVFLFDLQRFRHVNDSLGRSAGDALLKQVAGWLTRNSGDSNWVARVGADRFAVVLPDMADEAGAAAYIEKTMDAMLARPFHLNDSVLRVATKVGIALFPDHGGDADTLLRHAEAALRSAKASGERSLFYTPGMTAAAAGRLTLETQLRQALERDEFVLHYQPKADLASGQLTGAEALIRWNDPGEGLVPPNRFIPMLEETGLIVDVGRWALRQAIEDTLRWRAAGLPALRVAANVSALQLRGRGFVTELKNFLSIDPQAAAGLELEITESVIMEDLRNNVASLQAVRAMGVTIAIDDFGTGFSSLSYLAKLPLDSLKIDRSFVLGMSTGPEGLALISTIVGLAHSLRLSAVAEGVETEDQARLLRLLNCDQMQGNLFGLPVPAAAFEARFVKGAAAV
jgi:diguanylate cyclase (GGDEF)-like protein/PAS domain S-box-containing protein